MITIIATKCYIAPDSISAPDPVYWAYYTATPDSLAGQRIVDTFPYYVRCL